MLPTCWSASCMASLVLAVVVPGARATDLQIEHVTIVSAERTAPMADAVVRVRDGRIVSIAKADGAPPEAGADTTRIDATGMFLSPGLIDSHVHLGSVPGMRPDQEARHPDIARSARAQMPRSFLLYGFTTLIDLISTPQEMARWKSHDIVPDTLFCGGAALMDGYPMNYAPKPDRYEFWPYMLIEPGTTAPDGFDPAQHTPQAVIARMKADGAICVKAFFERGFGGVRDLPVPKLETIRELVRAAHAAGLTAMMHGSSDEAHRFGLDAGVDVMVHGLWNWGRQGAPAGEMPPGIRKVLDEEIERGIGWQATQQVLRGVTELFSTSFLADPRLSRVLPAPLIDWYRSSEGQWFRMVQWRGTADKSPSERERLVNEDLAPVIDRGQRATAYIVARHGRLLFGTDTPSAPTYANPPGLNGWLEMQRLVASGATPAQIFEAATRANARALKLDHDIGTVEVGKRANLLLLRQDPMQTIDAYAGIVKVILNGRVLEPAQLAANAAR